MLSVMATAKKSFVTIRQKLDFWKRREKTHFRFSLARSRVPKIRVGTVWSSRGDADHLSSTIFSYLTKPPLHSKIRSTITVLTNLLAAHF
jgi:hypothetical protein